MNAPRRTSGLECQELRLRNHRFAMMTSSVFRFTSCILIFFVVGCQRADEGVLPELDAHVVLFVLQVSCLVKTERIFLEHLLRKFELTFLLTMLFGHKAVHKYMVMQPIFELALPI